MRTGPTTIVYGLVDPRTLLVRYVGKSAVGFRRPKSHRRPSTLGTHTHKNHWVKSLFTLGLDFTIVVLEEVALKDALDTAEIWWIAYGRACGWPLTNATDGGEGVSNPSPEARARMGFRGRKHTAATRALLAARRRSEMALRTPEQNRAHFARGPKQHSEETRAKIASSGTGRKHTAETRAKISAANIARHARSPQTPWNLGKKHTPETRAKISAARQARRAK